MSADSHIEKAETSTEASSESRGPNADTVGGDGPFEDRDVEKTAPTVNRRREEDDDGDQTEDDGPEMSVLYATSSAADITPPDGGRKAWLQVGMGWIVLFTSWGYINSFGAFQGYYTTVLPQPPSTISWIGALQLWFTFFIGAFSGRLLDAGYFVPTFITGATLQVLGIFLMSVSDGQFWKLVLTQGVLTGIGSGIMFTPSMALVATYFDKKRALAIGLATTGNSAGGLVYPAIVRGLMPKLGFGWTTRVLGFLNLVGLIVAAVFMRPYLKPRKAGPIIELAAFKEPIWMAYVVGLFSLVWATYYTLYYLASFGVQVIGMPYTEAALLITIINGVGMPGRVLTPLLAIKIGPLNAMAIMSLSTSIVAYFWLAVQDSRGVFIFTAFYGVATACFQCLMPTGMASITPKLNKVGTRLGMAFSIASFAGLTGPPLGGAIEKGAGDGGYRNAQIWAAVVTMIGGLSMAASRLFKTGFKLKAKA